MPPKRSRKKCVNPFLGCSITCLEISPKGKSQFKVRLSDGRVCMCACHEILGPKSTLWFHTFLAFLQAVAQKAVQAEDPTPAFVRFSEFEAFCKRSACPLKPHQNGNYIFKTLRDDLKLGNKVFRLEHASHCTREDFPALREVIGRDLKEYIHWRAADTPDPEFALLIPSEEDWITLGVENRREMYKRIRYSLADQYRAHREYFAEGDRDDLVACRGMLMGTAAKDSRARNISRPYAVSKICNFLEQWSRAVEFGYLVFEEFNSSSGDMAAKMLLLCEKEIRVYRKSRNPRYSMWHAKLIVRMIEAGYLSHWPADRLEDLEKVARAFSAPSTEM